MSEIPIRSVRVPFILAGAAILGFGIGTWLGRVGPSAPTSPAVVVSPSPSFVIASPTSSPTLASPSSTPTAAATAVTVLEMEGTGDAVSVDFRASAGLRIDWRTTGTTFRLTMTGDQDLGTIVETSGPDEGVISVAVTGTFHLEISAEGPWSITVTRGGD